MKHRAWAKAEREHGDSIHPLAHHCMDVAATFLRMTRLPVIRNRLDTAAGTPLTDRQCGQLAALVFLHDIGKLHPGFQAKRWPPEICPGPRRGHLKEGWAFLMLAYQLPEHPFHGTMQKIATWCPSHTHAQSLFAALIAHHGSPVSTPTAPTLAGDWDHTAPPDYDWRSEARVMDSMLRRWFHQAFEKPRSVLPDSPSFYPFISPQLTRWRCRGWCCGRSFVCVHSAVVDQDRLVHEVGFPEFSCSRQGLSFG